MERHSDIVNVMCFYCRARLVREDVFVYCLVCLAKISCKLCWDETEKGYGSRGWSLTELKERQQMLLKNDKARALKGEPKLHERLDKHSFDLSHADWTIEEVDERQFGEGTLAQYNEALKDEIELELGRKEERSKSRRNAAENDK